MDRPRHRPSRSRRWTARAAVITGVVAVCVLPVLPVGTSILMPDPVVSPDTAAEGDLWPLVRAIVETVGEAVRDLLTLF